MHSAAQPMPHVVFRLGRQGFAIALQAVKDVARAPRVIAVPYAPAAISGLTVTRERVATVLDLRVRFGLPAAEKSGVALVIDHEGERVALLVDRVEDVVNVVPQPPLAAPNDPLWHGVIAGVIHREQDTVVVMDIAAIIDGVAPLSA